MAHQEDQIRQLLEKLELLMKRQEGFSAEINSLRHEISSLKGEEAAEEKSVLDKAAPTNIQEPTASATPPPIPEPAITKSPVPTFRAPSSLPQSSKPKKESSGIGRDFEKFIGENLINKIGIAILVIGVGIGAKYSIEHDLISPLTRIILGYLSGSGLLAVGIKLKKNFENYSAVLVSGAIAIMYFITFFAYSFYELIPQLPAFVMMVVITAFAVVAAIQYNMPVIAHLGLVGAYAVPFLLSDGSGRVEIMFSYMALINVGILIISFKKYWKSLLYTAFILSWGIYGIWFEAEYDIEKHFSIALGFSLIFFLIFYLCILAYKLIKKEKFAFPDIILLLLNAFIFYGFGYSILDENTSTTPLLGLFTVGNALLHFIVSLVIYKQKLADKNFFYLVVGLVLVFITMAIPVQLNGHWVTMLWAGEAALLFWIGRTKSVPVYEYLSYPLMALASFSLLQDWSVLGSYLNYGNPTHELAPIFNIHFLNALLFILAFAFINFIFRKTDFQSPFREGNLLFRIISALLPLVLIIAIFRTFSLEIEMFFTQKFNASAIPGITDEYGYSYDSHNRDINTFKNVWLTNYNLLFLSALSFANFKRYKQASFGKLNIVVNLLAVLIFLVVGLWEISELRESFLNRNEQELYIVGNFHIVIRYISLACLAVLLYFVYHYPRRDFMSKRFRKSSEIIMHTGILWVLSSELIHWLDIGGASESYKLGLSILWGLYSLFLIAIGIWKKKKYLRIAAIILFAFTLVKLFTYDLDGLDTIAKTIVFVSLGILLLIISFLYNKYKHFMADDIEEQ